MNYFITDDDPAIRGMLKDIVVDEDLGEVVGETSDGSFIDDSLLMNKRVDILLIDLLMPERDGIETIKALSSFRGKIVMISQVESKDLIGDAYSHGVEYYITKPINRIEVLHVLQRVQERIQLENSINGIKRSLDLLSKPVTEKQHTTGAQHHITSAGQFILSELGILEEKGSKDLMRILEYLYSHEQATDSFAYSFPPLKEIFINVSENKLGSASPSEIQKEVKACEQRIRRAIHHALTHIASLGLVDYLNPTFEKYGSKLFEYSEVIKRMQQLKKEETPSATQTRINTKKFIHAFYLEGKKQLGSSY